jgi:hypothetical protein
MVQVIARTKKIFGTYQEFNFEDHYEKWDSPPIVKKLT